jgi:hypothetical protein
MSHDTQPSLTSQCPHIYYITQHTTLLHIHDAAPTKKIANESCVDQVYIPIIGSIAAQYSIACLNQMTVTGAMVDLHLVQVGVQLLLLCCFSAGTIVSALVPVCVVDVGQ